MWMIIDSCKIPWKICIVYPVSWLEQTWGSIDVYDYIDLSLDMEIRYNRELFEL